MINQNGNQHPGSQKLMANAVASRRNKSVVRGLQVGPLHGMLVQQHDSIGSLHSNK